MLPSDLTLSALRFILSAKSRQSCLQDCETVDFCNSLCLLALLGDALLVGDEGCETAIGERVLEQTEDSLEWAGGYVGTDAHTVDDVLRVADAGCEHLRIKAIGLEGLYDVGDERDSV